LLRVGKDGLATAPVLLKSSKDKVAYNLRIIEQFLMALVQLVDSSLAVRQTLSAPVTGQPSH
jgi:hypothetical protein